MRRLRPRGPWRIAALALLSLAPAGCDPCFGVALCNVAPRVVVSGQILNDTTGRPERGATVDLIRVAGVGTSPDSVRATTDGDGLFLLEVQAGEVGRITADIVVRPKSGPGYRAFGVSVTTTTRGGEAFALPPWSTIPHLQDFAEIFRRGGARETIGNVDVEFRRTGGVTLRDVPSGVFRTRSGATGLAALFGDQVVPADAGEIIGDLTIFLPTPPGASTQTGFRITASPEFRKAAQIRRVGAGPSLNYLFQARRRARPDIVVPGVTLTFQQTGGPTIDPAGFTLTTDAAGNAFFPSRASTAGVVTGSVHVNTPAPFNSYTVASRAFPTFESDSLVVSPIGVGPWFPHYVVIRANGTRLKDARVDVQRVSGIAVSPSLFSATTSDSGIVRLHAEPSGTGEMVADITVTPPAPWTAFTVRGVRLVAVDSDATPVLLGDWDVKTPPASAIHLP